MHVKHNSLALRAYLSAKEENFGANFFTNPPAPRRARRRDSRRSLLFILFNLGFGGDYNLSSWCSAGAYYLYIIAEDLCSNPDSK